MSLTVNTNLAAISAYNNLSMTDMSLSGAIQKLSSGKQVTTAADNAAGYVISNELEQQANGYGVAISNAQNGVSVLQTAQGAMNQITSILQKMSTLALQAANSGATDATAKAADQAEFSALSSQIDQIASTTTFGSQNLLDGSYTNETFQVGSSNDTNDQIQVNIASVSSASLLSPPTIAGGASNFAPASPGAPEGTVVSGSAGSLVLKNFGGVTGNSATITVASGETAAKLAADISTQTGGAVTAAINSTTGNITLNGTNSFAIDNTASTAATLTGLGLTTFTSTTGPAVSLSTDPADAITAVKSALQSVSTAAGKLGAQQNEMTAIVSNLTVGQQNLQAADSQIVDTNMASEMTNFTSDQVLEQAGVAMLSQAQQSSQYVLKLLQ